MAAHGSQTTLYLAIPEFDAVESAALPSTGLIESHSNGNSITNAGSSSEWVYLKYSEQASTEGTFMPESTWFQDSINGRLTIRGIIPLSAVVYYGNSQDPAFTIPSCRGVIIHNNNSAVIYARRGTPNEYGLTIAKPGDANGDNVQGLPIAAGGDLILETGDFSPGDKWHLLASAASQTATIIFL